MANKPKETAKNQDRLDKVQQVRKMTSCYARSRS